jgi:hypothetical protein
MKRKFLGRRIRGAGVETTSQNRGCSAGTPHTAVSMPLAYLEENSTKSQKSLHAQPRRPDNKLVGSFGGHKFRINII